MTEENNKPEAASAVPASDTVSKKETPSKPEAVPKPQQKPKKETEKTDEKQTNCLACGKPIKKIKRYYRDGKFYCNKKCWKDYVKKIKEEKSGKT